MRIALLSCAALLAACGGETADGEVGQTTGGPLVAETGGDMLPPGRYRVELDAQTQDALVVALYLAPSDSPVLLDLPRAPGRIRRRAALRDVTCAETVVEQNADGFTLPVGCNVVRYRVALAQIGTEGYDPASRDAAADAAHRRFVLPGAAIFLVPASMTDRPTLDLRPPRGMPVFHTLADASDATGLALPPPADLAGVWIGMGAFREEVVSTGGTRVRQLVDADRELGALVPALALEYVARLAGQGAPREVLVLLFARRGGASAIGSIAGSATIATCYHADDDAEREVSARYAPQIAFLSAWMKVVAVSRVPEWVATSLAGFYGVRALREGGSVPAADLRALLGAVPRTAPTLKLLEAQAWLDGYGDAEAEAHFASAGPGFWAALDRSIETGSRNERTLDDVVQELLGLVYRPDGSPPARFTTALVEAGAGDAAAIMEEWLGSR